MLDIDAQGALKFHKAFPETNFFIVLPTSIEALRQRLIDRGTENAEKINVRVNNASGEISMFLANKNIF